MPTPRDRMIFALKNKAPYVADAAEAEAQLNAYTTDEPALQARAVAAAVELARHLVAADKVPAIKSLLVPPLESAGVVSEIYEKLQAVLHARNASTTLTSQNSAGVEAAALGWLASERVELKFKLNAWEAYRHTPSALMVIDAPAAGGEPYILFKPVGYLVGYEFKPQTEELVYAIFRDGDKPGVYYYYDETQYVTFAASSPDHVSEVANNPHNLGETPVRFFWAGGASEPRGKVVKQTAVTRKLPALARFDYTGASFYKQASANIHPVLTVVEQFCGRSFSMVFDNQTKNAVCVGGMLQVDGFDTGRACECRTGKSLAGPGTVLVKPAPGPGEPELNTAAEFVAPPIADVEFTDKKLRDMYDALIRSTTGATGRVLEREAVNETQVRANQDDRNTILRNLARQFSAAQTWAVNVLLRFKFPGAELVYVSNWGTEFYTRSETELVQAIKAARDAGAPVSFLQSLHVELREVRNVSNPARRQRLELLETLEPWPGLTATEAGQVSRAAFLEKATFPEFVRRFESENGDLVQWCARTPAYFAEFQKNFSKFVEIYLQPNE